MESSRPLIWLLPLLGDDAAQAECTQIHEALATAQANGLCEVEIHPIPQAEVLAEKALHPDWSARITLLHLVGPPGSARTVFDALPPGDLPRAQALRLVFLNHVAGEAVSEHLRKLGVPAVIRTAQAIKPDIATRLAERFYRGLGEGIYLEKAWREAEQYLKIRTPASAYGTLYQQESAAEEMSLPWDPIVFRPGAQIVGQWNLPDAVQDPLAGLPKVSFSEFPDPPFRYLSPFRKEDAAVFFGRSRYIRNLYQAITDPHDSALIQLYGQAGVGKSSLLEAGLRPYLEHTLDERGEQVAYAIHYLRRDVALGMDVQLAEALGLSAEASPAEMRQAWLASEQKGAKQVIVLDQLEEMFTQPRSSDQAEITRLMNALYGIFGQPSVAPKGKAILSYRKAFQPNLQHWLDQHHLNSHRIFLERLQEEDIKEVVRGLRQSPELIGVYNLEIDDTLPETIAQFLSADADSAVAPVLQILLSRMWAEAKRMDTGNPAFTLSLFEAVRKDSAYLAHFLRLQLRKLKQLHPGFVAEGLVTDLMTFLVGPMDTAITRQRSEIYHRYRQHRTRDLDQLLQDMLSLYILAPRGQGFTLGHDLLAPLARLQYQASTTPGQRAERLIRQKASFISEENPDLRPSMQEARLIEGGKMGMYDLNEAPEGLVWWKSDWFLDAFKKKKGSNVLVKVLGFLMAAILVGVIGFLLYVGVQALLPTFADSNAISYGFLTVFVGLMVYLGWSGYWRFFTKMAMATLLSVLLVVMTLICLMLVPGAAELIGMEEEAEMASAFMGSSDMGSTGDMGDFEIGGGMEAGEEDFTSSSGEIEETDDPSVEGGGITSSEPIPNLFARKDTLIEGEVAYVYKPLPDYVNEMGEYPEHVYARQWFEENGTMQYEYQLYEFPSEEFEAADERFGAESEAELVTESNPMVTVEYSLAEHSELLNGEMIEYLQNHQPPPLADGFLYVTFYDQAIMELQYTSIRFADLADITPEQLTFDPNQSGEGLFSEPETAPESDIMTLYSGLVLVEYNLATDYDKLRPESLAFLQNFELTERSGYLFTEYENGSLTTHFFRYESDANEHILRASEWEDPHATAAEMSAGESGFFGGAEGEEGPGLSGSVPTRNLIMLLVLFLLPFTALMFFLIKQETVEKYFRREAVLKKLKAAPLTYAYFVVFRALVTGNTYKKILFFFISFPTLYVLSVLLLLFSVAWIIFA